MSVTELPVDIVSTRNAGSFVLGDHTKRASWVNSFFVPATANVAYLSNKIEMLTPAFFGYGAVQGGSGATTDQIGLEDQGSTLPGFQQLYVIDQTGHGAVAALAKQVSSLTPSFPGGTLALAVIVLDGVGRIQQVIDNRPSYLSSAPNLGSGMTESVADPTRRVYFQNNYAVPRTYALSAQAPADIALPSPGFFLGSGAVVLSGSTITTQNMYISTTTSGVQLVKNGITQIFVSPATGLLSSQQAVTSGVFPANCLPICEATTDSVGLIRSLVDWRPSYI